MTTSRKLILAAAIGATALLAGCATGPYYDNGYGYDRGYGPGYGYDTGYVAPSVGLGFTYSDRSERNWRDNDGRWRDQDGRWHDRGDRREWRGDSRDSRTFDDAGRPLYDRDSGLYRGTGRDYDPKKDVGQYSGG